MPVRTPAKVEKLYLGHAVELSSEGLRAFKFRMSKWVRNTFIRYFLECPHCGALCGTKAGKYRHRAREARIEILLRNNGLLEPGDDIQIHPADY